MKYVVYYLECNLHHAKLLMTRLTGGENVSKDLCRHLLAYGMIHVLGFQLGIFSPVKLSLVICKRMEVQVHLPAQITRVDVIIRL